MEFNLILLIIGFLVVAFLIFKLIKKVVVAIITVVLVFILLVGGVVGLVYLDLNNLTSQQDFNVKVMYASGDNLLFGVNMPFENQTLAEDKITGIKKAEASTLDPEEVETDDGVFIVTIDDDFYDKVLVKKEYNLKDVSEDDMEDFENFNLTLTKAEVLQIIKSDNDLDTFVEILFDKNNIDGAAKKVAKPMVEEDLNKMLQEKNLTLRQAIFMFALGENVKSNDELITLFEGYKNEEMNVYPDRFSFKILRMLPIDTVNNFISDKVDLGK